MRRAVVVLGYSPNQENFEEVVWGIPPDKPGRIVTGLKIFLENQAELLIITGGTEKEGKKEAEVMRDLLYEKIEELYDFTVFPIFQGYFPSTIKEIIWRRLVLEISSKNTRENLQNVGKILYENSIDSVIIVTSPDHLSRALRDAIIIWQDEYPELTRNLFGSPSVTLYSKGKISDVVIAEPPVKKKFDFSRIFKILKNQEALEKLDRLLKEYQA
ncbi:YdcF family protein [bacterium]|nr:YdcF family protein [bacterium]